MCITEEQLVDAYGKGNPKQRFKLIYRNYGVFLKLVDSYEVGLFNRIEAPFGTYSHWSSCNIACRLL